MYELTKQKSNGYKIIVGIIVCAFITGILKMAFRETSSILNDELIKAANEINKHAPVIIDSTIRLDNVNALSRNVFQYNYTLLTLDGTQVDTNLLKSSGKESIIQQMRENPKTAVFKANNIEIRARYSDKNGAYITTVAIHPNEY